MTYPPQQPGPYGPQPDPYGQQPPQQPGWTGGFPQQQPGPYGQQPYGGGYPGMPPRKNKKGLIIGLAVGGVLLVGGAVTTILLLTGNDDKPAAGPGPQTGVTKDGTGSPDAIVDQVIKAIDDKDGDAARRTLCDPNSKSPAFELDEAPSTLNLKASLSGEITESGSTAQARIGIKATQTGKTGTQTITMRLSMKKDGQKWCVSTATMGSSGSTSSSTPRATSTRPTF